MIKKSGVISFWGSKFDVVQQKLGDQKFVAVIDFWRVEQILGVHKYCMAKTFGATNFEHANLFGSTLLNLFIGSKFFSRKNRFVQNKF